MCYKAASLGLRAPGPGLHNFRMISIDAQPQVADDLPFWETKPLSAMTRDEWESLCDGCGQCCLIKVEDEDTGNVFLTRLACRMLDTQSCRCRDYTNRRKRVSDC